MRNLMLATASAIVLGMAGAGIGHAAEQYSIPTNTPGSAMQMPSTMTASELLIKAAQQQLKFSGLYNGSVDGKMSSETQRAFRQFQQQHGLPQSGTLDEKRTQLFRAIWRRYRTSRLQPGTRWAAFRCSGLRLHQRLGTLSPVALPSRNSARRHCHPLAHGQEGRPRCGVRRPRHGEELIVGVHPFSRRPFVKAGGVIGYCNVLTARTNAGYRRNGVPGERSGEGG